MQLKLSFNLDKPLYLPLGHHATLQGFIYHLLGISKEYADFLHETGYMDGPHSFKLFVYSTLRGRHSIEHDKIIYYDRIYLDIRSPKPEFCNILMQSLQSNDTFELDHQKITLAECSFSKRAITIDSIDIRMLSPLTLSTTYREEEKKKTRYISPLDDDFADALNHNTSSKYTAAFNKEPASDIRLEILSLTGKDTYKTVFNNQIYITGWKGTYRLSGNPDILTFLYDTGLGSRNSQGFGMFETL